MGCAEGMGQANFGQGNWVCRRFLWARRQTDRHGFRHPGLDSRAVHSLARNSLAPQNPACSFPCPQFACPEKRRSRLAWLAFSGLRMRTFCCCRDAWHGGRRRAVRSGSDTLRRAAPVARWIPSEPRYRFLSASAQVLSQDLPPDMTQSERRKRPPCPVISQVRSFCRCGEISLIVWIALASYTWV